MRPEGTPRPSSWSSSSVGFSRRMRSTELRTSSMSADTSRPDAVLCRLQTCAAQVGWGGAGWGGEGSWEEANAVVEGDCSFVAGGGPEAHQVFAVLRARHRQQEDISMLPGHAPSPPPALTFGRLPVVRALGAPNPHARTFSPCARPGDSDRDPPALAPSPAPNPDTPLVPLDSGRGPAFSCLVPSTSLDRSRLTTLRVGS